MDVHILTKGAIFQPEEKGALFAFVKGLVLY